MKKNWRSKISLDCPFKLCKADKRFTGICLTRCCVGVSFLNFSKDAQYMNMVDLFRNRMRSKDVQYISTCSGVRVAEPHHLHPVPEQGGPVQGEDPLLLHQEPLPGLQG